METTCHDVDTQFLIRSIVSLLYLIFVLWQRKGIERTEDLKGARKYERNDRFTYNSQIIFLLIEIL